MPKIYYVVKEEKGIKREGSGKSFVYRDEQGDIIKDRKTLARIKSLVIPPAYKKVWICKSPNGHIQAYGYDNQNRKQYMYHPKWTAAQAKYKFDQLLQFGKCLPKIRRKVSRDLNAKRLSKNQMIAAVIRLLDTTSIRIGSKQYTSFGLLTLRKKHLKINDNLITLDFPGKSKKAWHVEIKDKRIAALIKVCDKKAGYEIFKYYDANNKLHPLSVSDINTYLKEITGEEVTAKFFRTWRGTAHFLEVFLKQKAKDSETKIRNCIKKVAKVLVNTPAVCKSSYIHPLIINVCRKQQAIHLSHSKFKRHSNLTEEENHLIYILSKIT